MKADLAYLDRAADTAVAAQLADPHAFLKDAPRARKHISGIQVVDQNAVNEHRLRLQNYRDDAEDLRKRLNDCGITVLAVLPKPAWTAIAKNADLFRFNPDPKDVSVPASSTMLNDIEAKAYEKVGRFGLAALALGGVIAGAVAWFLTISVLGLPLWGVLLTMSLFGVFGAFGGGMLNKKLFFGADNRPLATYVAKAETKLIRTAFKVPSPQLMRMLWPQEGFNVKNSIRIKIGMPPAPVEAQENLVKAVAAGYKLTLYADASAISFLEDPSDAFIAARLPHWKGVKAVQDAAAEQARLERIARRQALRDAFDPIVTIDYESVTAIIVQYGDFAPEKDAIDRVLSSDQLL